MIDEKQMFNDLVALCEHPDYGFYMVEREYQGIKYRIFSYRLIGSYTMWLLPNALNCRGTMFAFVDSLWKLVCLPMEKFFRIHENPLTMNIDVNDPNWEVYEKVDGCFPLKGNLNLWDGGTIEIGRVVKRKSHHRLIGMDSSGKLVPCFITNWKQTGVKTNWIDVEFEYVRKGRATNKIRVTTNHHVYINGKFTAIGNAIVGDELVHYEKEPCCHAMKIFEAGLLGDGSITKNGKKYRYQEAHTLPQYDYIAYIHQQLGTCAIDHLYEQKDRKNSFSAQPCFFSNSKSYNKLLELRCKWYPNGVKRVPDNLDFLDDFCVAKWICDDGSYAPQVNDAGSLRIATNGFVEEDVRRLAAHLENMYGVECGVSFSKGWYIRVLNSKGLIDNLWRRIVPHVPLCMRYKVPTAYHELPFVEWPLASEIYTTRTVKITNIEHLDSNNKKIFSSGRVGYDIETTTGNYFIGGVLVHNSLISTFINPTTNDVDFKSKTSLSSDHVIVARRLLNNPKNAHFKQYCLERERQGFTVNMELVSDDPNLRIVVPYAETALRVLCERNRSTGKVTQLLPKMTLQKLLSCNHTDTSTMTLPEALQYCETLTGIEGFVAFNPITNQTVKMKTVWYDNLHTTKSSLDSVDHIMRLILTETIDDFKAMFDGDVGVIRRINDVERAVVPVFNTMVFKATEFVDNNKHLDRKSYAILAKSSLNDFEFKMAMENYLGRSPDFVDYLIKNKNKYFNITTTIGIENEQ